MKSALLALILMTGTAHAMDDCAALGVIAKTSVQMHQKQVPVSSLMQAAKDTWGKKPELLSIVKTVVIEAYKLPVAVSAYDYANVVETSCYEDLQ